MKRMSALLLVLLTAAGLAGCGDKTVLPSNTNEKVPTSPQGTLKSPTISMPPPGQDKPPGR